MQSLGWKTENWKADYKLSVPHLSSEESQLVSEVAETFRGEAQRREIQSEDEARKTIAALLSSCCDSQGIELDSEQESYLAQAAYLQTFGLGFFQQLLSDSSLEEIAVIGLGLPVYVFARGKGWLKTNVCIDSQDYFVSLVNRMGRNLGRRLTAQQPRINAVLEDGSRLHASMPPVSGCELTIRKFGAEPFSPFQLIASQTFDSKSLALLSLAMQSDLSVIFAGNTASGKTSSLNAMLSFVPASERILLIEETPEISIPHPHQIRLLPFEESKIGMVELVRDSLRMRPDRVVIGEVRSAEEAQAFAESALSGQAKGCYATFHAQSARDALLRMRMMGCTEADLEGIDLIAVQRRVSKYDSRKRKIGEERKLTEIAVSSQDDSLHPKTIFNGKAFSHPALSSLFEKISAGSGMDAKQISRELILREKFLRGKKAAIPFARAFDEIQKFCFGR
jgi:type IV secretory pathway ATPase VirB11/archaellum biosynthesis ATPase